MKVGMSVPLSERKGVVRAVALLAADAEKVLPRDAGYTIEVRRSDEYDDGFPRWTAAWHAEMA